MADDDTKEMFWGIELSRDNEEHKWTFEDEDDDQDYLTHTLFIKVCTLGQSAVKGERNVVEMETKMGAEKKTVKMPIASLTLGQQEMCSMDISFGHEVPVTFRLVQGTGPISLIGQHMIEFPDDGAYNSQDETFAEDETEEDDVEDEDEDEEDLEEDSPKKATKRKAEKQTDKKSKKVKLTESTSSAGEGEEDDLDEDENDVSMDSEESPKKGDKKKKKSKAETKAKKTLKTTKKSPKVSKVMKKTGKVSKK